MQRSVYESNMRKGMREVRMIAFRGERQGRNCHIDVGD